MQESGQKLFMFEVRTRPDVDAPDMIVTAPIGFYRPDGIRLAVDGGNAIELIVQRELSEAFSPRLKMATGFRSHSPHARNYSQTIELPLAGFTTIYASIKR